MPHANRRLYRMLMAGLLVLGTAVASGPASAIAGELDSITGESDSGESDSGESDSAARRPIDRQRREFFENSVRPLLAKNCFACHGPEKQQSDLRLDSLQRILAGGTSGPAIVPGQPDQSLLVEAVRYDSFEMPPEQPLSSQEVAILERWIQLGAPWPDSDAVARDQNRFTEADRQYWAFQPVQRPALPQLADPRWCRSPIDYWVLQRLEAAQLDPAPQADRRTLIRRVTFDVLGVPPTPERVARFVRDPAPDAYERLVDELLSDPAAGEHLARFWLDLVRYAESDGFKQDAYRPQAWRYRDYVIDALNRDLPYDRFVREQLAGDELDSDDPQALAATGFLRLFLYEYNQRDARTQWADILNQTTDITADVFLALGYGCARCHDHKFDPILRDDYYRLQAFFAPMIPRDDQPVARADELSDHRAAQQQWQRAAQDILDQIAAIRQPYLDRAEKVAVERFPPDVQKLVSKPRSEQTPLEIQISYLVEQQVVFDQQTVSLSKEDQQQVDLLQEELSNLEADRPAELPTLMTVSDLGAVDPRVEIPGDRRHRDIRPGFPSVLDSDPAQFTSPSNRANSTGRRLALADWITRSDNPLTSRVLVNRLWQVYFGQGIVATPSDFGRLGDPPSHPELLDYLAHRLVASGWSWKAVQREILCSSTYRQASGHPDGARCWNADPLNRLYWHHDLKRLTAEQLRDATLTISGQLDRTQGGPGVTADAPRRGVYLTVMRNSPDELLGTFDAPDGINSTAQRNETVTAGQALLLLNGQWMRDQARHLAQSIQADKLRTAAGGDESLRVALRELFYRVLLREPSEEELRDLAELSKGTDGSLPLYDAAHVLLNSNEFLYLQ